MKKEEIVSNFMASHEPDTFLPNPDGFYFYYSEDMTSGINLVHFFQDLVEDVLELNNAENKELIIQLDKWIEDCKIEAIKYQNKGDTLSYISSDAMAVAYNNVKQLLNNNYQNHTK